jgi:hypothetical protein
MAIFKRVFAAATAAASVGALSLAPIGVSAVTLEPTSTAPYTVFMNLISGSESVSEPDGANGVSIETDGTYTVIYTYEEGASTIDFLTLDSNINAYAFAPSGSTDPVADGTVNISVDTIELVRANGTTTTLAQTTTTTSVQADAADAAEESTATTTADAATTTDGAAVTTTTTAAAIRDVITYKGPSSGALTLISLTGSADTTAATTTEQAAATTTTATEEAGATGTDVTTTTTATGSSTAQCYRLNILNTLGASPITDIDSTLPSGGAQAGDILEVTFKVSGLEDTPSYTTTTQNGKSSNGSTYTSVATTSNVTKTADAGVVAILVGATAAASLAVGAMTVRRSRKRK